MDSSFTCLVCGDEKVGKTSVINSFVSSNFTETPTSVLPSVFIPPGHVGKLNNGMTILDTSSSDESIFNLMSGMDVVVVVFASDRPLTFERLRSFWLPKITESIKVNTPIIIVRNKSDLGNTVDQEEERAQYRPLLRDFPNVELGLPCSAKLMTNIKYLFYMANKCVKFPYRPLWDVGTNDLRDSFLLACVRVFRIFDADRDNALSDEEMMKVQVHCFELAQASLKEADIAALKDLITSHPNNERESGVNEKNMITMAGWTRLLKIFLERQKPESVWMILKKFGYDNEEGLLLRSDDGLKLKYTAPPLPDKKDLSETFELSPVAVKFLSDIVDRTIWSTDHISGQLNVTEIESIFEILPKDVLPFGSLDDLPPNTMVEVIEGTKKWFIKKHNWIALWNMMALLQPEKCMEYLYYIGFPALCLINKPNLKGLEFETCFVKTRPRKVGSKSDRNVFQVYLFGDSGCGKSTLLKWILDRPRESKDDVLSTSIDAEGSIVISNGLEGDDERFIVFTEKSKPNDQDIRKCDVALLCFENPNPGRQLSYLNSVLEDFLMKNHIPAQFVITKTDTRAGPWNKSDVFGLMVEHCAQYCLDPPIAYNEMIQSQFVKLVSNIARNPVTFYPEKRDEKEAAERTRRNYIAGGSVLTVIALAFVYVRYVVSKGRTS